jgi:hypothetical protein
MKLPAQAAAVLWGTAPRPAPRTPSGRPGPVPAAVSASSCVAPQFYFCHCPNGTERCCVTPDYGGNGCSDIGTTACGCNP